MKIVIIMIIVIVTVIVIDKVRACDGTPTRAAAASDATPCNAIAMIRFESTTFAVNPGWSEQKRNKKW
jgi:hypothetical protein